MAHSWDAFFPAGLIGYRLKIIGDCAKQIGPDMLKAKNANSIPRAIMHQMECLRAPMHDKQGGAGEIIPEAIFGDKAPSYESQLQTCRENLAYEWVAGIRTARTRGIDLVETAKLLEDFLDTGPRGNGIFKWQSSVKDADREEAFGVVRRLFETGLITSMTSESPLDKFRGQRNDLRSRLAACLEAYDARYGSTPTLPKAMPHARCHFDLDAPEQF